jgi:cyclohexyl-isocyanide hydratase
VVDGNWVFAAGVTAGIDGALRVAAELRGEKVAQGIQLGMEYAPEPPFSSGTPGEAPADVLAEARKAGKEMAARRLETARGIAKRLGIQPASKT